MKKSNVIKKQERLKFLDAIVYAILIIITVIANTYGSIYIKLIPLLFFLGIIGKVVFSRPILTSLFGGTFSIIVMHINGAYTIKEILILSLTNTLLILIGEIFGVCLITCYKTTNNKSISISDKVKNYIISVLFFVLCIYMTFYMSGNIFRFKNSEYRLMEYLRNNYQNLSFEVNGYRYIPYVNRGYIFKVKNIQNENTYKFIVYEKETLEIYDGFKTSILKVKNNNINNFIANNISINSIESEAQYTKYNEVCINAIVTVDSDDFYYEASDIIINFISKLVLYKDVDEITDINIIVKNDKYILSTTSFSIKDYIQQMAQSKEKEYIINMLKVEFFDF